MEGEGHAAGLVLDAAVRRGVQHRVAPQALADIRALAGGGGAVGRGGRRQRRGGGGIMSMFESSMPLGLEILSLWTPTVFSARRRGACERMQASLKQIFGCQYTGLEAFSIDVISKWRDTAGREREEKERRGRK